MRYRMWPCSVVSGKLIVKARNIVYQIIDKAMLFEFGPGKLPHVSPGALLGNIGGAANNVSPQSQCSLPLNELQYSEWPRL
jgi:hypothetical protein